jgi:hypothetical protein
MLGLLPVILSDRSVQAKSTKRVPDDKIPSCVSDYSSLRTCSDWGCVSEMSGTGLSRLNRRHR